MRKRSLFLSAAAGIALTLTAASPSSLVLEGGQPRVTTGGTPLPSFTGFPQSLQNTAGAQSSTTLPGGVPSITDAAKFAASQRPGMWKAASAGELRGLLTSRNQWVNQRAFHAGIYRIPTSGAGGSYSQLTIDNQSVYGGSEGVWTPEGYFISVTQSFMGIPIGKTYHVVNPEDWTVTKSYTGNMSLSMGAMTYNELGVYVNVFYTEGKEKGFGIFDIFSGVLTKKHVYPESESEWKAMAFGKDGNLFAINGAGDLLKVNPLNGEYTTVGNIGIATAYWCGATYDKLADTFYLTLNCDSKVAGAGLYAVDTATAKLTQIYPFNDEERFVGLYMTDNIAAPAPAAATDLAVKRNDASLTVEVSFKMPTTTYDGKAASGAANYKLYLNGVEMKSGSSQFGKSETVSVTAPEEGYYSVCVIASNGEGQGEPAIVKSFIGYDSLLPVTNVKMSHDGSKFNVSWDKAEPQFGGYVDYSQVTYTVTRMPDNKVVAEGISETSYIDTTPLMAGSESYFFNVVANYRGQSTAPVASNAEILGTIAPPYRETFDTEEAFKRFTTFSCDGNIIQWQWHPEKFNVFCSTFWVDNNDDWLISPAIQVEKGKTYQISIDLASREPGKTENFRLWVGDKCNVESMTTKVIEYEDFEHLDYRTVTGDFTATKSGLVYIGLEAYNKNNVIGNTVFADNLYVSAPISPAAPDAITDLEIKAADYGKLEATVSFKAPAKTVGGQTLSSIDNIKVRRNGTEIKTLTATPGQAVSFTDTNEDGGMINGINNYEFVVSNSEGPGRSTIASQYIGYATPVKPAAAKTVIGDKPNKVVVSWDAVTTDVNGNKLPLTGVSYILYRFNTDGQYTEIYSGTDLTYTDEACPEDEDQTFIYYGVGASIGDFYGDLAPTQFTAVGKPYAMPWSESFTDKAVSSICAVSSPSKSYGWGVYSDADVMGMASSDGDNGMAIMGSESEETGVSSDIFFGFVDLGAAKNPCLLFDFYGYNSKNTISVLVNDGNGYKEAETFNLKAGSFWTRRAIDLKDYSGKAVQLMFRGTINDNPLIAIDAIRIADVYSDDLKAIGLTAPRKVEANVEIPMTFAYSNEGFKDAKDYTIRLLRDGVEIENVKGEEIEAGEKAEITFKTQLSVTDRDDVVYTAIIDYAADADKTNNEAECVIGVTLPEYPVAEGLTLKRDGNEDVVAEWNDPDLTKAPYEPTVDGAEDYTAYSIGLPHSVVSGDNLGEWTVIDGDGKETLTLKDVDYPNEGAAMAWMVLSNAEHGLKDLFPVYEGSKQFMCFSPKDGSAADNWLISPELLGCAQTISFIAQTEVPDFGFDKFEIWYSTSGTAREDFQKLGATQVVPGTWTEFSFNLPEGAKHFAIRGVSEMTYAFSVDNIRFIKAGAGRMDLAVNGFNIYRNSKRVNAESIVENTYLDKDAEARKAGKYEVTVVYDRGESAPSAAANITAASGIAEIGGGVKVSVERGTLVVSGAEGQRLTVFSASGLVVADMEADATVRIPLAKGIYTLRVGKRTVKVMI